MKTKRLQLQGPLGDKNILTLVIKTPGPDWPPDTETMIYRVENLDPDITYTDFTISYSNRTKAGYTDTLTEWYIPAAFQDTDGTWYKVVANYDSVSTAFRVMSTTIEKVFLPDTMVSLGNYGFLITAVNQPKSVYLGASISELHIHTFRNRKNLQEITVSPKNQYFTVEDGVLMSKDKTVLYYYLPMREGTEYTIPSTVTELRGYAFSITQKLEHLTIPPTVTTVSNHVCVGIGVKSVDYYPSYTIVPYNFFYGCTNLATVNLSENIETIASVAFHGCTALEEITIPAGMKTIYPDAFEDCTALTRMVFENPANWYKTSYHTNPTSFTAIDLSDPTVAPGFMTDENNTQYLMRATAYQYNGISLPPLPEWDKTARPYAWILEQPNLTDDGSYFELTVSGLKPIVQLFTPTWGEFEAIYVNPNENEINETNRFIRCRLEDSAWGDFYTGGATNVDQYKNIVWTNFDLYHSESLGGDLVMGASDPVPVFG